ncbi:unnamed protein product [Acanthoscelides obtectus]|uniref:FLYWCH-type domain-containing protein n=1 Tax=Acanthoscelides obtectus TaxID=200917 RepID=A0A9P0L5I3_ACAOB|nr:unnamed protein product [Acanthoscelides obtectus]CAK1676624.1 hypothetical protein AOBTE_LOCUS30866 [Acanthoscelides obtectus]
MVLQDEKKTKWRCVSYEKTKCRSVIYTTGKKVNCRQTHNHQAKPIDPKTILVPQYVKIVRS